MQCPRGDLSDAVMHPLPSQVPAPSRRPHPRPGPAWPETQMCSTGTRRQFMRLKSNFGRHHQAGQTATASTSYVGVTTAGRISRTMTGDCASGVQFGPDGAWCAPYLGPASSDLPLLRASITPLTCMKHAELVRVYVNANANFSPTLRGQSLTPPPSCCCCPCCLLH